MSIALTSAAVNELHQCIISGKTVTIKREKINVEVQKGQLPRAQGKLSRQRHQPVNFILRLADNTEQRKHVYVRLHFLKRVSIYLLYERSNISVVYKHLTADIDHNQ